LPTLYDRPRHDIGDLTSSYTRLKLKTISLVLPGPIRGRYKCLSVWSADYVCHCEFMVNITIVMVYDSIPITTCILLEGHFPVFRNGVLKKIVKYREKKINRDKICIYAPIIRHVCSYKQKIDYFSLNSVPIKYRYIYI